MTTPIKKTVFIIIGIYGFLTGFGVSLVHTVNKTLPPLSSLEKYTPFQITKVYDRNLKLLYEFYQERRIPVLLSNMPKLLIDATLSTEDKKFYRHHGIDLLGIIRAITFSVLRQKAIQATSTITQQLARSLFLTRERTLFRKIKEILLAIRIEQTYLKSEIIELYLNQIYYGNGAYGVEAASQCYFGKNVQELILPECALLAGLPRTPAKYNPFLHPTQALERRSLVLTLMAEDRMISNEEAERAKNAPLGIIEKQVRERFGLYFIEEVKNWTMAKFGPDLLYRSGTSIYTTLDLDLQKIAEKSVNEMLDKLETIHQICAGGTSASGRKDTLAPLQVALLSLDPKTGEILALVGGRDFRESMFNRALQAKRQPGSSFKPFTWLAAFGSGYTPASIMLDAPIVVEAGDTIYSPHNYDQKFLGPITLRKGLALSRNLVAVRLIMKIGPKKVLGYAKRMGITSKLEPVISLAIGANSVTLLDMVSAFATLATEGSRTTPFMIKKVIKENDEVLYEHFEFKEQVIPRELAYLVISLMQSVLDEGTAISARSLGFNLPAAGKTGTTNNCADAWFVGFTPSLVCGVWVGYDQMKRIGKNATGAKFALPIWTDFMKQALKSQPVEIFEVPPGVVHRKICEKSGKLASPFCKHTREEIFIKGTEPTEICNLHGPLTQESAKEFGKFERLDSKTPKPEF
ncbi:PBP1A family penicillin-binding protein [candidate division WOR-3 bacterium]|nr:PBP1A family penicillin-binding protein [candidate division WOR-3 bacterium]